MKLSKLVPFGIWAILLVFGIVGVVERVVSGHELANYGSYVPWGLWVAAYIFFMGLSAGTFLLSCAIYGFGIKRFEPIGRLALFTAAVTLVLGLISVVFDLGHPLRALEVIFRPNFRSMMTWMIWLYMAYAVLLLVMMRFALRSHLAGARDLGGLRGRTARLLLGARASSTEQDQRVLRKLAFLGLPLATAFSGGVGALFATVAAQELWHTGLFPILFLIGALASGGALLAGLLAFTWSPRDEQWLQLSRSAGRVLLALILVYSVLEWAEYSVPLWYGAGPDAAKVTSLLFGEFWYVFWVIHVLIGTAIPVVLLSLRPRQPRAVGVAGVLVVASFLAVRLNMVIPSLVTPQLKGLERSYQDSRLSFDYVPSLFEWQVLTFVLALGVALLYLGYRYLPIGTSTKEVSR